MVCRARKAMLLAVAGLVVLSAAGCQTSRTFEYIPGPDSTARPWTKAPAATSEGPLRFAIASDRCGGHRPGVFEDAVAKLNTLQPDLVMCVGDLVEGYVLDGNVANQMWDEFEGIIAPLSAPFFHVRGNHDSEYAAMDQVWRQRVGPRYYAFVYRDCLFLCLNTLDGNLKEGVWETGVSPAQAQWVAKVLAGHPQVRWTFVFMHHPLWLMDEDAVAKAMPGKAPKLTGFAKVEDELGGRPYTVFAGHFHQYAKCARRGRDYYVLSTTGGGSDLRGGSAGEFDEIVWISMTPQGPRMANLELKGILPDDVRTDRTERLQTGLGRWKIEKVDKDPMRIQFALQATNRSAKPVSVSAVVKIAEGSHWQVEPATATFRIEPNQAGKCPFVATLTGPASGVLPVPYCEVQAGPAGEPPLKVTSFMPLDTIQEYLLPKPPTVACVKAAAPPTCDGKLEEPSWRRPATGAFTERRMSRIPLAGTEGYLAYDKDNLYVALRCQEPNMPALKAAATSGEDGALFRDDCVEFFFASTADRKQYYQFVANAAGAVIGTKGKPDNWRSSVKASAARDANGWSVEMAIPWKDLGVTAARPGDRVAVLFSRTRRQTGELYQWPPSPVGNHDSAAYAEAVLGE